LELEMNLVGLVGPSSLSMVVGTPSNYYQNPPFTSHAKDENHSQNSQFPPNLQHCNCSTNEEFSISLNS